ncbi:Multidrug efflux pump subunit AcrB [Litoreibacter ascidiaceicola]|uniref:Multidrug efflux pump subunit AcrB n=1 Tax=Litoreibacter ascidiaceicola TaxID=1486859 RepID=A0A1M5BM62_9RHOB|nr:efflux RND transporter permease subunit [Litoreibacter ascidiaceicola]SHF43486.1 Multidrug efflux pump subunit AcrB [Litoreibacter ascidiaceicola]
MIALFTRHATAANILMLLFIGLGIAALPTLQRDSFPEIPPSDVEVRIVYPGAAPADVETGICMVAEDPIRSVDNLAELTCQARDNMAVLTAEIVEGADMTRFAADVKAAVDGVTAYPAKADAPVTRIMERVANVASIAVTGPADPKVLFAYADQFAEFLKADPKISQATVGGFSDREIVIEISATALQRHGLTISAVAAALSRNSLDVPTGTLEGPEGDALVRFAGERRTPGELATIPLLGSELGTEILLGDVAKISNRFADDYNATFYNSKRAAIVSVSKTSTQDALRVMAAIEARLDTARAQAPAGIELEISQDSTSNITERLRIITTNGLQGLILVLIVMGLFFGLRFSFWVALTLPVSFLGTIFVMQLMGLTINMITMVALLVAIGLLMDDSIVISENIVRRRLAGETPVQAALNGVAQVGPGVMASFLTTVMIVGPLGLMAGQIGAVLKFLPVVLVITLVVSLIEAFLVLPNHLAHALRGDMRPNRVNRWMNGFFDILRDRAIVPLARQALRFRYFTLGLVGFIFLVSLTPFTAGLIKFQSFPTLESDTVEARLLLAQGAPLSQTEARVQKVVAALEKLNAAETPKQPDSQPLVQSVTVSFGSNADAASESGPHLATVSAKLLPAGTRTTTVTQIVNDWKKATGPMPDMASLRFTDKERGVGGKPIDVRLQGPDMAALETTAREMRAFFRAFQGVRDVAYDLRPGKPEYVVSLRPAAASALGVTAQGIATELRASFRGDTGLEVQDALGGLDVVARLNLSDRNSASDIANIRVSGTGGALVPLSSVADISLTRGYASITRIDGMRTVSVTGSINADVANSRELMAAMRADFLPELSQRHPDVNVVVVGESKDTATTGASLMRNLAMGLIGVWLILAYQFRSFIQPIAVFLAIPLGVIGMMWGHFALGMQLSMPSFVGLATLAGVVVNNSILLVEFIKIHHNTSDDLMESGVSAVRDRFRPIFLTSLTTVVGLGPLLFEQSTQAQFLRPIVASLAFGLSGATLLALFVTPAAYMVLHDLRLVRRVAESLDS